MLLLALAVDSVYVERPSRVPYYLTLASSALSTAMVGGGSFLVLSSDDERNGLLGGLLITAGALVFAVSTTVSRLLYGDYRGGATSCCVKTGSCALLTASMLVGGDSFNVVSAAGFTLSSLGCLTSSAYDMLFVHNVANMKVKTVEVVRMDTVYDTVRVRERDTVVVVKVVKRVKRRAYRRRITQRDRRRAEEEYRMGLEAYAQDRLEEALRHFERALRYDPTYEKAREAVRRLKSRLRRTE